MSADFLHDIIGAGQLGLLLGIFLRLGKLGEIVRDHARRIGLLERRV